MEVVLSLGSREEIWLPESMIKRIPHRLKKFDGASQL